jgi:M6 family metalloprotease-like protein
MRGSISWTPQTGAHEVHGLIREKWASLGRERSWLGYPLTDETPIPGFSCAGCYGRFNKFEHGDIYYTPDAGAVAVPDLAGDIYTHKLSPQLGIQPVLTIIWNPHYDPNSTQDPLPQTGYMSFKENIKRRLFGPDPSVASWYDENSNKKLTLMNAGILGPYESQKTGSHYWNDEYHKVNNDGWKKGHVEKWAEAILRAAQDFDFASYDVNKDGVLTADELAILIVIPGTGNSGHVRDFADSRYANNSTFFQLDGKEGRLQIKSIAEWYTPNTADLSLGLPAHELSHLFMDTPDLYFGEWQPYAADIYSMMKNDPQATHFDPFIKLKSGWLSYTVAIGNGDYTLRDVETSAQVLVLYDPGHSASEYFIIENRFRGSSYDNGRPGAGGGLPNDGIAIWHIIEDPALYPNPGGEWGREGIRLIRADGGVPNGQDCHTVQSQECVPTRPGAPPICRTVEKQVCVPREPDDAKALLSHLGDWISDHDARRDG